MTTTTARPQDDPRFWHYPTRYIRMGQGRDVCACCHRPWPCETYTEFMAGLEGEKEGTCT